MSNSTTEYKVNARISHNVDTEYNIVFDKCTAVVHGIERSEEELLMRYAKNGKTVNRAPAFNEIDMVKTIVKLYDSQLLSIEAKEILRLGIH